MTCSYLALICSYPLEPGCRKQHGDHVIFHYCLLFSQPGYSVAEHLLHSDFPPELLHSEQNTTDNKQHKKRTKGERWGKTETQRDKLLQTTSPHCTTFKRPLVSPKNDQM